MDKINNIINKIRTTSLDNLLPILLGTLYIGALIYAWFYIQFDNDNFNNTIVAIVWLSSLIGISIIMISLSIVLYAVNNFLNSTQGIHSNLWNKWGIPLFIKNFILYIPCLIIDLVKDIKNCNDEAFLVKQPRKTGLIILGGGVAKHHMANANLMRNGADFAVYMSTATEHDGSDSGARPDEAVSWGKITLDARPVKCYVDCTIGFPLLVSRTFAKPGGDWVPKKA